MKAVPLPILLERLHERFPDARYELDWGTPLELLVATILAAQCTDERVNEVTKTLFPKYRSAQAYADADVEALGEDIKPTGFYRKKAERIQEVCRDLVARFGGQVPASMDDMVSLPGIGRKTANVILNTAFKMPTGVIVDTHVQRISPRLGLTEQSRPEKIEQDLMRQVPQDEWVFFGPAMVLFGRDVCTHYHPDCAGCFVRDLCPRHGVDTPEEDDMPAKKTAPAKKATAPVVAEVPSLAALLPPDWREALKDEFTKPYFRKLEKFVGSERAAGEVYPPATEVFAAFHATPFADVKVVLLGQDPYHGKGEAHGLSFSVKPGVKVPPSLANIHKEMQDDLGLSPPAHGDLSAWTKRGVLLLNSVLTVRADSAGSHKDQGWETFTDAVIKAVAARARPAVFLLWGGYAKKKGELIGARHKVLTAGHPSPLSSKTFFGSRPFSGANKALADLGLTPVDWRLDGAKPKDEPRPAPTVAAMAPVSAPASGEACLLMEAVPEAWRRLLAAECAAPSFRNLDRFLAGDRLDNVVCPAEGDVFAALRMTPPEKVRVVLLGAEPVSASDLADGLAFSVREGADPTPQQRVMFRTLRETLGCRIPTTGSLEAWARQGVLLLNVTLTVREGRPGSHAGKGWEAFTDGVIRAVSAGPEPCVFILLGQTAQKKRTLIDTTRHGIIKAEHPALSPEEFLGVNVFGAANDALERRGRPAVYWQLPYA